MSAIETSPTTTTTPTTKQPKTTTLLPRGVIDTLSGSAGGAALVLVGHPFDTLKVRMQSDGSRFKGTMDCVRQTYQKEGLNGFYKGIGSPLVGVTIVNAVCFFAYNQGLQLYYNVLDRSSTEEHDRLSTSPFRVAPYIVGGALTGVALSFIESPVELIKAKLQVQYGDASTRQYNGSFDCTRKILSQYGMRGIFQGYAATLARNVPANVAYFAFYEWMKKQLSQGAPNGEIAPLAILAAGGMAGAFYWISSFPIDVIKSRMQTDHLDKAQRSYANMWDCAKKMKAQYGFRSFYWGFAPCLLRAFPANGACFFTYELTKKFLSGMTTTVEEE